MGKEFIKKIKILAAFLFVIQPVFTFGYFESIGYSLSWEHIKRIPDHDGDIIKTLSFKGSVHYKEFGYLPVYPIEIIGEWIDSIEIEQFEPVKLTEEEVVYVINQNLKGYPKIFLKQIKQGNTNLTKVWVFPFIKDSISGEFYKLNTFKLNYTSGKNIEVKDELHRTANKISSVLSQGNWHKIGITKDGIYKIDYDYLNSLGINPDQINPKNLRLYGNGGAMLPQSNAASRREDLTENSIMVIGETDNKFNQEDYLLFFGQSPHKIDLRLIDSEVSVYYDHHNYSDTTYYFLTVSDEPGLRIRNKQDLGNNYPKIRSFDHLSYHEQDLYNVLTNWGSGSGREWYGELFRITTSYEFEYELPGLVKNSDITVISSVMAQTYAPSTFALYLNDNELGIQKMDAIPESRYAIKGKESINTFELNSNTFPENTDKISLKYTYNRGHSTFSDGYLNYFNIWCIRELAGYQDQIIFRSTESLQNPVSTFEIKDLGIAISIWDVSNPLYPAAQLLSKHDDVYCFGSETSELKKFIIFNDHNVMIPYSLGKINNQDLHSLTTPELLIVSHPNFLTAANRLAQFKEQKGITTHVANIFEIYNEFSSGAQDVTAIRDFVKYLYDNDDRLKYLLLFGRGSFDYKNKINFNTNFVPIYESRNSLHPIYSYSSDDYYGFLDQDEGEWEESFIGDHLMDISVGRLPVKSLAEANNIVDKIILYGTDKRCFGPWRNNIYFVADDGDGTDGVRHSKDADKLSVKVDTTYSNFNIRKIYVDAFKQNIQPSFEEAPDVNEAIRNAVKNGALLINFTGHGNENQWTRENILNISSINQWDNIFKLPLLVTATCEFGRHDDPLKRSGAEYALISERGGAIALVTTARPVFASTNFILNEAFYQHIFERVDGAYQTVGDVFKKTKNSSLNGSLNRNFSLLGDPSMKLAYPDQNIVIDRINENPVNEVEDTLKALKNVRVHGKILDLENKKIEGFNGLLTATVYDKAEMKQTLGTQDPVLVYEERNSLIFRGDVSVKNGEFDFEFIIPKNINYKVGEGKISLYSIDDNKSLDAAGSNVDFFVGGSSNDFRFDDSPPDVILYLEDSTFNFGDLTSDHPRLIADIFDESGVNIIENNISKGLIIIVDENDEIVVNQFYKANVDDFRSGKLNYQLSDLNEGRHSVLLKVWDTHNNLKEASTEFIVGEDNKLLLKNVINYPNPFRNETRFSFEHNRSGENLSINIQIFTIKGQLVKSIDGVINYSEFRINDISWDGRGESGKKLESGLYIYRVFVRSLLDGAKNAHYEKLIIIK